MLFKWHYLPPNFSHIFKHIVEKLATIHPFLSTCNWMKPAFHKLIFSLWVLAYTSKRNSSFLSPVLKLQRPSMSSKWWQVSLLKKVPHEIVLIFWTQMEPSQDLVTHLVSALMNKETLPVIMTHWCPHQHTFHSERLCQETWKFCHRLLKVGPQFHQTQGLCSPHF